MCGCGKKSKDLRAEIQLELVWWQSADQGKIRNLGQKVRFLI
jgi:hypothetical protein